MCRSQQAETSFLSCVSLLMQVPKDHCGRVYTRLQTCLCLSVVQLDLQSSSRDQLSVLLVLQITKDHCGRVYI